MIDYKKYPSITRILADTKSERDRMALERWRKRVGEIEADRISKTSLERGKKYDAMVQSYIDGEDIEHKPFQEFLESIDILFTEQDVYSHIYGYKGRYDCLAQIDGQKVLIDFKGAGKRKDPRYMHDNMQQLSAYRYALSEMGIELDYMMLVYILPSEIQTHIVGAVNYNLQLNTFMQRLRLYNEQG